MSLQPQVIYCVPEETARVARVGGVNAVTSPALVGMTGEKVIASIALLSIAAISGIAGVIAARISKRSLTGLWVGLLVGVIASLIANTTRVGYSIAFYDIVRHDPGELRDWVRRGSGSFVEYLIDDRLGRYSIRRCSSVVSVAFVAS